MGGAKHIGRVVWMAVALGIAAAVITQCEGVAGAAPSDSSHNTSSSGGAGAGAPSAPKSAGATTSPQTSSAPGLPGATGSTFAAAPKSASPFGVVIGTHGVRTRSASGISAASPPARGAEPAPAGSATTQRPASTARYSSNGGRSPATSGPSPQVGGIGATPPTLDPLTPTGSAVPAAAAVTTSAQGSVPTTTVPQAARVATYVSGLLNFVMSPFVAAGGNPAPTNSPMAWTVLGWVRRELFNDPTRRDATLGPTGQPPKP